MDWELVAAVLGTSGIVATTLGYFTQRLTSQYDYALKQAQEAYTRALTTQSTIDEDLRTKRLPPYAALWKLTEVLPQWPPNEMCTYKDLQTFSASLRDWYFHDGGWLLSELARKAYGEVQEILWDKSKGVLWVPGASPPTLQTGLVEESAYETVRKCCHALRTQLTRDLESRRPGPIADTPVSSGVLP